MSLTTPGGAGGALEDEDHPGANHPRRDQVLTSQPEQQRRRVMLHRAGEQELVKLLPLDAVHRPPAAVRDNLPQMIWTGLPPLPLAAQLTHRNVRRCDNRPTAAAGAPPPGPAPIQATATCTAAPPRPARCGQCGTSARTPHQHPVTVKCRISSTRLSPGPRGCASSSSENTSRVRAPRPARDPTAAPCHRVRRLSLRTGR